MTSHETRSNQPIRQTTHNWNHNAHPWRLLHHGRPPTISDTARAHTSVCDTASDRNWPRGALHPRGRAYHIRTPAASEM